MRKPLFVVAAVASLILAVFFVRYFFLFAKKPAGKLVTAETSRAESCRILRSGCLIFRSSLTSCSGLRKTSTASADF